MIVNQADIAATPSIEDVGPEDKATEDAEGVTMLDVLQDEKELEEDAR